VRQTEYKRGYVFGAVDPLSGKSSALIAPTVSTAVSTALMSEHLRMIAEEAGDDTHEVLVLDGATDLPDHRGGHTRQQVCSNRVANARAGDDRSKRETPLNQ